MDCASIVVFSVALFVAAASPGPGLAAIVARVLGRGRKGALAFTFGIALGDVVWLTFAIAGLAVLAQTFQAVFVVVKWIGVAYLILLAWKMWTAPVSAQDVAADLANEKPAALVLAGLAVTMGNPKVMVFYLALLPTTLNLTNVSILGYAALVAATLGVLAAVFGIYIALAVRARLMFTNPAAIRLINCSSAMAMTGAAAWVASR